MIGIVTELVDAPDVPELKSVLLAPDDAPLLPATLVDLAHWMSSYYATPLGIALRAMLPSALWGASRLVAELRDVSMETGGATRHLVEALERAGGKAAARTLEQRLGRPVWEGLQRLARVGSVRLEHEPAELGPRVAAERVVVLLQSLPTLLERERLFKRAGR